MNRKRIELQRYGPQQRDMLRIFLKRYKVDRRYRKGSSTVEDIIADIYDLKPMPPEAEVEHHESKALSVAIDAFLNFRSDPNPRRLRLISLLLISHNYISEEELLACDDDVVTHNTGHRLSDFLTNGAGRTASDKLVQEGNYFFLPKSNERTHVNYLILREVECSCCLAVTEEIITTSDVLRPVSAGYARQQFVGWASPTSDGAYLAFLRRTSDSSIVVKRISRANAEGSVVPVTRIAPESSSTASYRRAVKNADF